MSLAFDPTISAGAVGIFISNLVCILGYFMRVEKRLDKLDYSMETFDSGMKAVKTELVRVAENNTRLAAYEERLTNLSRMVSTAQNDISELRKGNGFITRPLRNEVNGEY